MKVTGLFNLQGTLFVMTLTDVTFRRCGIIDKLGKKCLTDLCVSTIIPCNIIKSCLITFDVSVLKACNMLLAVGTLIQPLCVFLNRFLFNGYHEQQKKVLQYCTIVSNGSSLGNPVIENVYGNSGLSHTPVFLIPMRVVMWSAGISYFVAGSTDPKEIIYDILTYPCLVTIYTGMFLMMTQVQLPVLLVSSIQTIGNCSSTIAMSITGTILTDVNIKTIVNKATFWFSVLRLILLPLIAFGLGLLSGLSPAAAGTGMIMTGMPAGAAAVIFTARYNSDAPFVTKCIISTTLFSMVAIPIWCYIIG